MKPESQLSLPIKKGAIDNSFQSIAANSQSTSNIDWQYTPPSESVFIARKPLVESTLRIVVTITTPALSVPNGTNVWDICRNTCLQSYPLHRLATEVSCGINNSKVDLNLQDVIVALLQMQDEEDMREYQTGCAIMSDRYANYADCVSTNWNNPFDGYNRGYNKRILPRGVQRINVVAVSRNAGADNSLVKLADGDTWDITCDVTTVLLPPFQSGKFGEDCSSFLGISKFSLRYTLDQTARRMFSSALYGSTTVVCRLTNVSNSNLYMNYLNGDAYSLYPERVLHEYYEFDPQIHTVTQALNARVLLGGVNYTNLQLGEIPDKIILYARKRFADQTAKDSDVTFPIRSLSVTFNARTALLSSMTPDQLYLMSKRNGLKNVDFYQFYGEAQVYDAGYIAGANNANNRLYLSGGCVVIDPSRDLGLTNPYITSNSTGQFNFNFFCSVFNPTSENLASFELVAIMCYKRILTTSTGRSTVEEPAFNMKLVQETLDSNREALLPPNDQESLMGGKRQTVIAKGISGGASRSGGKSGRKLDSLLI
jgi:hypothetical protein